MPKSHWRITLDVALGVTLAASLAVIVHESRQLSRLRGESAADQRALRDLREKLHQRELQQIPVGTEELSPPLDERAALARRRATLEQLQRELDGARSSIALLQTQLSESRNERDRALTAAGEKYRQDQAAWQSRLDALKQRLDAAETESQASHERIGALEAENNQLKSTRSENSASSARVARGISDLQDLARRRDLCLTSLTRRYGDITSQFRAMSGMLDSSRDPNSSSFSGGALLRIQNEISLADDDLRQLNDVNAQIRQLEKKLTAMTATP